MWYASSAPMGIYSRHALKVGVDINKLHFRKDSVLDSIIDIKQESSSDILLLFNCIEIWRRKTRKLELICNVIISWNKLKPIHYQTVSKSLQCQLSNDSLWAKGHYVCEGRAWYAIGELNRCNIIGKQWQALKALQICHVNTEDLFNFTANIYSIVKIFSILSSYQ